MTKQITVGYDGSKASSEAVLWAAGEASARGVVLRVVSCYEIPYAGEAVGGWVATEAHAAYLAVETSSSQARDLTNIDAGCLLDRAVESARDRFGITITGQLVEGGPATAVLATVREGDLLVLGSRGRSAFTANLFGSTVNTVLDRCSVPVVVVRGEDA